MAKTKNTANVADIVEAAAAVEEPKTAEQELPVVQTAPQTLAQAVRQADVMMHKQEQAIHSKLSQQDRVSVTIAPQYRPYFGDVMAVFLQGLAVYVPVDGHSYKIPKDFAAIVHERLARVNAHLLKCERLSNVQANVESYAGELQLY